MGYKSYCFFFFASAKILSSNSYNVNLSDIALSANLQYWMRSIGNDKKNNIIPQTCFYLMFKLWFIVQVMSYRIGNNFTCISIGSETLEIIFAEYQSKTQTVRAKIVGVYLACTWVYSSPCGFILGLIFSVEKIWFSC